MLFCFNLGLGDGLVIKVLLPIFQSEGMSLSSNLFFWNILKIEDSVFSY